jgi:hypothetical protein
LTEEFLRKKHVYVYLERRNRIGISQKSV